LQAQLTIVITNAQEQLRTILASSRIKFAVTQLQQCQDAVVASCSMQRLAWLQVKVLDMFKEAFGSQLEPAMISAS